MAGSRSGGTYFGGRDRNSSQLVSRVIVDYIVVISYCLQADRLVQARNNPVSGTSDRSIIDARSSVGDPVTIRDSSDDSGSGLPWTCVADIPAFRQRFGEHRYSDGGMGESHSEREFHQLSNIVEKVSIGPDGREMAKTL